MGHDHDHHHHDHDHDGHHHHDHDHDHGTGPTTELDYRSILMAESLRFADLVEAGPLDSAVPGCPEWDLRDLAVHLGGVQRWATAIIDAREPVAADSPPCEPLADWFREGTAELLSAIDINDPGADCWNLWPTAEKTVGFWHRRQALETAVHRYDAEEALGLDPARFDPAVGADLVDEWVHVMLARALEKSGKDLSILDGDVHFHCTDTPGEWTFEIVSGELMIVDEHRKSTVAARGPAHDLALLCYNRGDRSGVEIFGDTALLDRWLA